LANTEGSAGAWGLAVAGGAGETTAAAAAAAAAAEAAVAAAEAEAAAEATGGRWTRSLAGVPVAGGRTCLDMAARSDDSCCVVGLGCC
jgi:hypothetical protein